MNTLKTIKITARNKGYDVHAPYAGVRRIAKPLARINPFVIKRPGQFRSVSLC